MTSESPELVDLFAAQEAAREELRVLLENSEAGGPRWAEVLPYVKKCEEAAAAIERFQVPS
ncbi:hypothetical protein [Spirilliplanes yamanashiensis]|uniref:Uncharacterized protein n=1 Tax=Spirilliplanes yamanashiensis TaxID=42233 RepID=A0A8J4DI69_9ACTN|nr:hypothetical protein [Spirilliplanes yamanashiensis]MDP9814816.1 hypothetical protein [Spirilliplanes yamanashiensis]GIJ02471.1 hypothetical protein Sya03_18230 [Spirilliplanes yamanashiensis]